jgi:hypothetical protein
MQSLDNGSGGVIPPGDENEFDTGICRIPKVALTVGVGGRGGRVIANCVEAEIAQGFNNFRDIGIFPVGIVDMCINSE